MLFSIAWLVAAWMLAMGNCGQEMIERPSQGTFRLFNAIIGALRTNETISVENGMTMFVARIDQGAVVYHGRDRSSPPSQMEWVAFDPNFAMHFARPPRGPPPAPPSPPPEQWSVNANWGKEEFHRHASQTVFQDGTDSEDEGEGGTLHSFITRTPLTLLYLDGLSAMKRSSGTLDLQDILLLNNTVNRTEPKSLPRRGGPMGETARAQGLCDLAKRRWNKRIEGFIRKDFEWEIIICSFHQSLEWIDSINIVSSPKRLASQKRFPGGFETNDLPNRWQDDSIIQTQVQVDFDRLVSAYTYPTIDFGSDRLPRLKLLKEHDRRKIMNDLDKVILDDSHHGSGVHWQARAELFVARFRPLLDLIASKNETLLNDIQNQLKEAVGPYVELADRNHEKEVRRCTRQAQPMNADESRSLAQETVMSVGRYVCSVMISASNASSLSEAEELLAALAEVLQWSSSPL